jgi:hypothetical protein
MSDMCTDLTCTILDLTCYLIGPNISCPADISGEDVVVSKVRLCLNAIALWNDDGKYTQTCINNGWSY